MNLHARWLQLLADCDVSAKDGEVLFEQLRQCYTQPHRYYHNLNHLAQMFSLLEQAGVNELSARWAAWFHDAIYKPGNADNEQRSAEWARHAMLELSLPLDAISRVEQIILATKAHQGEADDSVLCAVLDADMSILGSEPLAYQQYAENVRNEFAHIPDFLYRQGRGRFLRAVLNRFQIFRLPWFQQRLESQARKNIEHELKSM